MTEQAVPRVVVDRTKCIGTGNCSFYASKTFDLDDDNKAIVVDPEGDAVEAIKRAVAECPTRALSFAGGSSG